MHAYVLDIFLNVMTGCIAKSNGERIFLAQFHVRDDSVVVCKNSFCPQQ